eukprot:CAMPEP_0113296420 /NCGR_PEP_ID=MMETSP0008_2-20120614/36983_1 /TAXON_ID=97485 /ORGANISM="Prymnesium parvum" /LENGTH=112 /DNA_ID=CAMNT_0000149219 /DNA_START=217 /DNA_END=555 /DNA_ORIENTATION=+ /assembly_acc=CAM_ASM_000153
MRNCHISQRLWRVTLAAALAAHLSTSEPLLLCDSSHCTSIEVERIPFTSNGSLGTGDAPRRDGHGPLPVTILDEDVCGLPVVGGYLLLHVISIQPHQRSAAPAEPWTSHPHG